MKNNFHSLGWTSKVKFLIQDVWLMLGIIDIWSND